MTVESIKRHPGYAEAIFCSGARVLASGAMFAGLALALGGGHFTIATLAALPYAARLMHLAMPELLRRFHAGRVAHVATWLERSGFLIAALAGIIRPPGFTLGANLSIDGWFRTIAVSKVERMGELIFLSDSMAMQLAVPPLISGP